MSMDAIKVDSACCNLASTQYNGNYFFGRTWTVLFTCLYEHDMVEAQKNSISVKSCLYRKCEDWRKLLFAKMYLVAYTQMMTFFFRPIFFCIGRHSFS